jgi:hypothetical protein
VTFRLQLAIGASCLTLYWILLFDGRADQLAQGAVTLQLDFSKGSLGKLACCRMITLAIAIRSPSAVAMLAARDASGARVVRLVGRSRCEGLS